MITEKTMDTVDTAEKPDYQSIATMRSELNRALKGKSDVIDLVLAGLLAGGHILFDDLPGLGKTTLGKAIAAVVGGEFGRIQGTPDLLPSDVTGFSIYNRKTQELEFRKGPVFADVLLADEINRATPRTQSALFEAMGERQVSIDGNTYPLSPTFFVIATQNPVDHHGTFALPEAQLDRFAMKLTIGYPSVEDEAQLLEEYAARNSKNMQPINRVITPGVLLQLQDQVSGVLVAKKVQKYLLDIAAAIRTHKEVRNGLSPRALIAMQRVAQANALLNQRDFVTPDDIQHIAKPVLGVRLAGNFDLGESIVDEVLSSISVPVK